MPSVPDNPETGKLSGPLQWVLVVAIIGVLAALVFPAIKSGSRKGDALPSRPPQEVNRIHDEESGISIVAPEGWIHRRLPGGVSLNPPAMGRAASMLTISLQGAPDAADTAGFHHVLIQGAPAFVNTAIDRESTFDDPAITRSKVFMKTGQQWLDVEFFAQGKYTELPAAVLLYLETIRVRP